MELPDHSSWSTVAFDTETFDPDLIEDGPGFVYNKAHIVGFSVYSDTGYGEYFPVRHQVGQNFEGRWQGWLAALMARTNLEVITANGRYDLEALWSENISCMGKVIDIQVVEALLDESQTSYSLDNIGKRRGFPGKNKGPLEEELVRRKYIVAKGRNRGKPDYSKLNMLEPEWVSQYAKEDAKLTYDIWQQQIKEVMDQELTTVARLESDLIPVLLDMRVRGVRVDIPAAENMNARLGAECVELMESFKRDSGMNIDPFSSQSIAKYLDSIGVEVPRTEKDNESVTGEFLETLVEDPACVALAKYRRIEKIRRDFVEGMVLQSSYKGRLHPQYFQTRGTSFMSGEDGDNVSGTRSGRIGTVNPNLSQIPSRYPVYGKLVRSLFIPEDGETWCKADFNQQEPRILLDFAYKLKYAGATELRDIYINDPSTDYHQMMTDRVNKVRFGAPISRRQGKDINLGLAYGLGKAKMAKRLGISQTESNNILGDYHEANPFVRQLQNKCIEVAVERGYVKTVLGRRRRFIDWEPVNWSLSRGKTMRDRDEAMKLWGRVRRSMCHKALNSIVQGSAADQMKKALVTIYGEGITLLVTLYDETGTSIVNSGQARRVKEIMETAVPFEVPHYVPLELGDSWGNTAPLET